ncbi:MAG: glycosyltransferase family 4 protein [Phycisphaerae bacterium]|jgi:glycosyltransferase involved in cell wall biosynthesis
MRKLRIAFLSGGTFGHIRPYIDFFRERGHEIAWITYDRPDRDYGVPTYDISFGASGARTLSKWKYFLSAFAIRRLLREIKPDVVHGHYVSSAGTICLLSGFRPYVLTVHGSDLLDRGRSPIWRPVLRRSFAAAALVNAVSDELKDQAIGLGVSSDKIVVATLGIDLARFPYRPHRTMAEPVRLLCTRRLEPVYDPTTLLRACRCLQERGLAHELTFAAGGPMHGELVRLADSLGVAGSVRFLGGYAPADLPRLMSGHDVYVSASLWDGTSLSLLEAMACGVFPVVSRIASNQAWLEEGSSALMFDRGSAEQLAACIERLARDAPLLAAGVERNRRLVEEKGDRRRNMSLLEEHLLRVAR